MDIDPYRIATHPLTAGLGGALVGLKFAPGLTWAERATNVIAGVSLTVWVAPAISEWFGLAATRSEAAISFAIGLFGMSVAASIFDVIRTVEWAKIVRSLIERIWGK